MSEIYSDQLDLRGQFYHIEANKQDYIAYYSSKTKKKYALEYYWKRDALVMVSCSSEAGKMPLLYKVTQMKQTINHGYQRIKLEMDDGQIFEEEIVVPTKRWGIDWGKKDKFRYFTDDGVNFYGGFDGNFLCSSRVI